MCSWDTLNLKIINHKLFNNHEAFILIKYVTERTNKNLGTTHRLFEA